MASSRRTNKRRAEVKETNLEYDKDFHRETLVSWIANGIKVHEAMTKLGIESGSND